MHNPRSVDGRPEVLQLQSDGRGHWRADSAKSIDDNTEMSLEQSSVDQGAEILTCTVEQWLELKEKGVLKERRYGLRLSVDDELEPLKNDLIECALIVVDFPHFTDGRGFSLAAQLRDRYRYRGALRAEGYLLIDQLSYLVRCGFDSFVFSNEVDPARAESALAGFSVAYQPAAVIELV